MRWFQIQLSLELANPFSLNCDSVGRVHCTARHQPSSIVSSVYDAAQTTVPFDGALKILNADSLQLLDERQEIGHVLH